MMRAFSDRVDWNRGRKGEYLGNRVFMEWDIENNNSA